MSSPGYLRWTAQGEGWAPGWLLVDELERGQLRARWRAAAPFDKLWHGGVELEQIHPVYCRRWAAGDTEGMVE